MNLEINATNKEIKIVEANGKKIFLPKKLNLTSPGKRPIPNFSNQGSKEENTISTRKIITNQRIIDIPNGVNTYIWS
jgi:hypothetical protein